MHQNLELSFQEEKTAQRLSDALSSLYPVSLEYVADTGIVARIQGKNKNAPVIALRADIDALPIQEKTGLSYASKNPGIMYACGHDIHAVWAVGAAHLLSQNPACGDVVILLQPAEETGEGALKIIKSGILNDVSAIFAG